MYGCKIWIEYVAFVKVLSKMKARKLTIFEYKCSPVHHARLHADDSHNEWRDSSVAEAVRILKKKYWSEFCLIHVVAQRLFATPDLMITDGLPLTKRFFFWFASHSFDCVRAHKSHAAPACSWHDGTQTTTNVTIANDKTLTYLDV